MYEEIKGEEAKKKDLMQVIKDAQSGHSEYKELMEKMGGLRARKKELDAVIRSQFASEFNDLDDARRQIKELKVVLSDLMWNELMKNNAIEVKDEYDNRYVPEVTVTLRKDG